MGKRRANMWWLDDWVRTSPVLQLLWGVPGLQWSVSIKSEPRTEQRRTGLWATKVHWCTWGVKAGPCGPIQQTAIVVQIAKEVNDGSDRAVRVPMLTPVHCQKHQQWACEHQNWTMEQWKKNLGSCHPYGYFDTYHLPEHCCRLFIPFRGSSILWWLWPLSAG